MHVRLPSKACARRYALRVRVAVLDAPFQVAVSSAEAFAVTADEALAVNVALDFAAGIVTDDGTVTAALPLDRLTLVIPVATFVRATVQVELPGGVKMAGMHVRLPSTGGAGALSARVAVFAVPFKVAVSSAEPFALTAAAALAVNVALDVPVPIGYRRWYRDGCVAARQAYAHRADCQSRQAHRASRNARRRERVRRATKAVENGGWCVVRQDGCLGRSVPGCSQQR